MMKLFRKWLRANRGSVAVEFAFIAPVAAALIVGAWDVGKAINSATSMTSLARSGIQYATSKYWDPVLVKSAVQAEASRTGLSGVSVTTAATCLCSDGTTPNSCTTGTSCPAGAVLQVFSEVGASQNFNSTLPLPVLSNGGVTITRTTTFRVR